MFYGLECYDNAYILHIFYAQIVFKTVVQILS